MKAYKTQIFDEFASDEKLFFIYGFAKSQKDNITPKEKKR